MNQQKLEKYNLTGSIHTLAVNSPGFLLDIDEAVSACIIANSQTKKGKTTTTSIINANKLMGDVFSYSEFETALDTILAGAGIEEYDLKRVDMRFDSYDPEHYHTFAKLNRYLISALAMSSKSIKGYRSTDLFTQRQLSVVVKNRYFEAENYDKYAESDGRDKAKSRLETRSKSWTDNDIKYEFMVKWFQRWDNVLGNLDKVQIRYNEELVKLYQSEKDAYPCRFRSLTDFIIQYQDCIFTRKQLIGLFSTLGVENPVNRAKNYKQAYGIEFFSKTDVKRAVEEIKRATREFYDN